MINVCSVMKNSPADKAGILPGDIIVSVNSHEVNDVLDFSFYSSEKKVSLLVHRGADLFSVNVKKGEYEDIGISSETFLMDSKKVCKNKCVFCFIDQNPCGMRKTIYFKDDDSRLSFLQGSYMTLTNMERKDIDRICEMHMSPVNVSVHTTNPDLRIKMMKNPRAGEVLDYLPILCNAGIKVNCQIVLCKNLNDKEELSRTMRDLAFLYPGVVSVSVVPAGLTKHRDSLYPLEPFTKEEAKEIISEVDAFAQDFKNKNGVRLFYCSDELYIEAGLPLPEEDYYDGYPQIENGVGMIASMKAEFYDEIKYLSEDYDINVEKTISIATGKAAYSFIDSLAKEIEKICPKLKINVYPIVNEFFGENVTVAGLICGCDLISQLKGKELGSALLIPTVMLRSEGDRFLDDLTLEYVSNSLGIKIVPSASSGADFIKSVMLS